MGRGCAFAKRPEKGKFSAAWKHAKSSSGYEMTLGELALFIEGSDVATRMPLSLELKHQLAAAACEGSDQLELLDQSWN